MASCACGFVLWTRPSSAAGRHRGRPLSVLVAGLAPNRLLRRHQAAGHQGGRRTISRALRRSGRQGGNLNEDGVIVFAPSYNSRLYRVSSSGGDPTPVTELDSERGDNSHRHPRFLPDGRHFLFMARSSAGTPEGHVVLVGSLDGSTTVLPLRSPAYVEYASGHLLFPRDRTLMARPFDAGTLQFSGEAFPVAEDMTLLAPGTVAGVFSASQNGILAFQRGRGGGGGLRLMWRSARVGSYNPSENPGHSTSSSCRPTAPWRCSVSRTRQRDPGHLDLRPPTRGGEPLHLQPRFRGGLAPTPDGKTLYFTTETSGSYILQRKDIGGSGNGEVVLESRATSIPPVFLPTARHSRSPGAAGNRL